MNRRTTVMGAMLLSLFTGQLWALDYPAPPPGETIGSANDRRLVLANRILDAGWTLDAGRITAAAINNRHTDQAVLLKTGHMPRIVLDDGRNVDPAALTPLRPAHIENNTLLLDTKDDASGLAIRWRTPMRLGNGQSARRRHGCRRARRRESRDGLVAAGRPMRSCDPLRDSLC